MLWGLQPDQLFFGIIILIGLLTSATDLWQRKIYNVHLALGAVLGFLALAFAFSTNRAIIIAHFADGALAFLVGWLMYRFNLWRGGDAKLFALYALLMPVLEPDTVLFSNTARLFACSFIFGMILFLPVFIKDIALNYNVIATSVSSKREAIIQAAGTSMFFSWIIAPVFIAAKITNPVVILTVSYLLFMWGYDEAGKTDYILGFFKKKRFEICAGILFGFGMRLWLAPGSLAWPVVIHSFLRIGIFAVVSAVIHTALDHLKEYQNRVAFAPLLWIGCMLGYTPFLTSIRNLIAQ